MYSFVNSGGGGEEGEAGVVGEDGGVCGGVNVAEATQQ